MHGILRDRRLNEIASHRGKGESLLFAPNQPSRFLSRVQSIADHPIDVPAPVESPQAIVDQWQIDQRTPAIPAYLRLVLRGGRWIRCVRQRAPRRGTMPQSRQGRAKPLRHEALLLLPIPRRRRRFLLGLPPRVPPRSRGSRVLSAIPQQIARGPASTARHGDDDRSRGSREIRRSAASCR